MFFFGNYEGQRRAIDEVVTRTLPTQPFYDGSLGYQDDAGTTHWLSASDVKALDSDCSTNVRLRSESQRPRSTLPRWPQKESIGTAPTAGDGVNTAGYIFASPAPVTLNTGIGKIDYTINARQRVFVRGNLQKDTGNLPTGFDGLSRAGEPRTTAGSRICRASRRPRLV